MRKKINENPDHTVWTVDEGAIRRVFATAEQAQKYVDKMDKENIFKIKKLDVNPANLKSKQR